MNALEVLRMMMDVNVRFVIAGDYSAIGLISSSIRIVVHPRDFGLMRVFNMKLDTSIDGTMYFLETTDKRIEVFRTMSIPGFGYFELDNYDVDENGFSCWTRKQMLSFQDAMENDG